VVMASSPGVASPPVTVLIAESGRVITKQATHIHGNYETTFSGIPTDNYLLAIDVRDRMTVGKPRSPVGHPPRLPAGQGKAMGERRNKYAR